MKLEQAQLPVPLAVCLLCQVLYRAFASMQFTCTAREMLFGGLCAACLLSLGLFVLYVLALRCFGEGARRAKRAIAALVCILLLLGAVGGIAQQMQLYYRQFGTGVLWVLLFALLACGLHCAPHGLLRCARLLLFFCAVVAAICAVGLAEQSSWRNLSVEALTMQGFINGFWAGFLVLPEYLALVVCAMPREKMRKCGGLLPVLALPFFVVAVQVLVVLCSELVFGAQQAGVGGFEFLRSWAFLNFSRFDGVVVLLWLLLAFFRLRFLCFLAQQVNPFAKEVAKTSGEVA